MIVGASSNPDEKTRDEQFDNYDSNSGQQPLLQHSSAAAMKNSAATTLHYNNNSINSRSMHCKNEVGQQHYDDNKNGSGMSRYDFSNTKETMLQTKTLDFCTRGDKAARNYDKDDMSRDVGFYSSPTAGVGALSAGGDSSASSTRRLKQVALWELFSLTSFNVIYGLICSTMGLFILPAEAQRLYPTAESIMLGVSLGVVGVSQLVCPVAGQISDKMPGRQPVSRRAPFIIGGTICAGISVLGMWASSQFMVGWLYYVSLFFGMVSLNVVYSVQCGLVPDLCTTDIEGRASGVVAVNTIGGSALGFVMMMATNHMDYHYAYPLYFIGLILSALLSLLVAHRLQNRTRHAVLTPLVTASSSIEDIDVDADTPETTTPRSESEIDARVSYSTDFNSLRVLERQLELAERRNQRRFTLTWSDILSCYTMDGWWRSDFFWVFLGRTFYYVAVSCQAFMLYYLRDVIGTADVDQRKLQIGTIALCAQGLAASVAYPVGRWSDSEDVNKKSLIYLACGLMAMTYLGFMFAPLFGQHAFWFVVATALLYGVGNGCFLAVDYALALATIPNKDKSAQALGIWGVSAFIGSAIGPLVWGLLIDVFGSSPTLPEGEYLYRGYLAMLWGGVFFTACAGWIITFVRKTV